MNPRTATEAQIEFINAFLGDQDQVNDVAVGSEVYNLSRATGRLASEIETETILELQRSRRSQFQGQQLDLEAKDQGVSARKPAKAAVGRLVIQATPGTQIISGTLARRRESELATLQNYIIRDTITIGDSREGTVNIVAQTPGTEANADAGTITDLVVPNPRVLQVFNPARVSGGQPNESDASLLERINLRPEKLRGATRSAIRAALLDIPGIERVETIPRTPNPGDCTVVISDATGGITDALIQAAKLAVVGTGIFGLSAEVGSAGIFYVFKAPRRLILDLSYTVKATQEASLPTMATALRAVATQAAAKMRPGTQLDPMTFSTVSQKVEGLISIEAVQIRATHGLEVITGVAITSLVFGTDITSTGITPSLRYVASNASLSFNGGPSASFPASGLARLRSPSGLSYIDVVVDKPNLSVSSGTEFIQTQIVDQFTVVNIGLDELPVIGAVTVTKVA